MFVHPLTTLFLIQSLDGKISTGDTDALDVDKDFPKLPEVGLGLHQYYDLEKQTDWVSFNTGKVQAKVGANERVWTEEKKDDLCFVIVDNQPHLTTQGCEYFAKRSQVLYIITSNAQHPAFGLQEAYPNIKILCYAGKVDFVDAFTQLKEKYGVEKMTIQTGGTLNAELLGLNLIDRVSIVIAPCLIGGMNTMSLIGGESLHTEADLVHVKSLKLEKCEVLEHSYLHVQYTVIY